MSILLLVLFCSAMVCYDCNANTLDESSKQNGTLDSRSSGATVQLHVAEEQLDTRQSYGNGNYGNDNIPPFTIGYKPFPNRCPLCDSSVYPYCGEKMLHDACCCTDPYISDRPHQCKLADCRFLHANTCREHRLIANCCCSDDYRSLLSSLAKN